MTETPDPDPAVYSRTGQWVPDDTPDGGHMEWFTWKELAQRQQEQINRLRLFQSLVLDLDRNPNGRHEGDADVGSPTGISQGNPKLLTGDVVGYGIGGHPILMPPRDKRHDPTAWRAGR